jgi:hypothetical protein
MISGLVYRNPLPPEARLYAAPKVRPVVVAQSQGCLKVRPPDRGGHLFLAQQRGKVVIGQVLERGLVGTVQVHQALDIRAANLAGVIEPVLVQGEFIIEELPAWTSMKVLGSLFNSLKSWIKRT